MSKKIKIGISSCLLGNNVRYDGGHKRNQSLIDAFGPLVEWVPICPEVEAGLPIPRGPMQLVADHGETRLIAIETKRDHTVRVMQWAEQKLSELETQGLCGFIFKARSPSCAVCDAEIFSPSGALATNGPGIFAQALMQRMLSLPLEDEDGLEDPVVREDFLERVSQYAREHV